MRSRRGRLTEFLEYVGTSVGMALACTGYAMLGDLRRLAPGPLLIAAIAVAAGICMMLSLSISELASRYPTAPGIRTYLRGAFGDTASLALTYTTLAVLGLFAGVESLFFAQVIRPLVGSVPDGLVMFGILLLVTLTNLLGVNVPRRVQLVGTALLVLLLVGGSTVALFAQPSAPGGSETSGAGPTSFGAAVGAAVFLFTGFEWVTPLGRQPSAYRRLLPLSMPVALLVLALTFAALAAAFDRLAPTHPSATVTGAPHVFVGQSAFGRAGWVAMLAASALSVFTTFNAGLMGAARLVYALSRERRFPAWGGRLWLGTGVPVGGVVFTAALAAAGQLVVLKLSLQQVASLVCASLYCFVYSAYIAAAVRLRHLQPGAAPPFRSFIPGFLQLALAAAFAGLGIAVVGVDSELVETVGLINAGIVVVAAVLAAAVARRNGVAAAADRASGRAVRGVRS